MNEKIDVMDRDARTLYDLACIRAEREDATREDVEAQAIALRLWTNLAAIAELIEATPSLLALYRIKWGNLDPDANAVLATFERAFSRVGGGK